MGTISETTQKNDCWNPTPMPMKTWLAMRVLTSWATAPMMLPMRAMPLPMIKNLGHLCQSGEGAVCMSGGKIPSSAKDIGQLTNHEEDDSAEHNIRKRYPEDVG